MPIYADDSSNGLRRVFTSRHIPIGMPLWYGISPENSGHFSEAIAVKKKVVFHVGFHKTGSSALQGFLAINANKLAAAGIGYPHPDPPHIVAVGGCNGNAHQMLHWGGFMNGVRIGDDLSRLFNEAYFDKLAEVIDAEPRSTVLISSEILSERPGVHFSRFVEKYRHRFDIQVVCFVRDPFDFLFSMWRQLFKEAINVPGFSGYIDRILENPDNIPSMIGSFELFHNLDVPLKVINYDRNTNSVCESFLGVLSEENLSGKMGMENVGEANKSLSPSEICLAQLAHETIGNTDFTATFLRMAQSRSKREFRDYYNRCQHRRILDRFQETIVLINSYLPKDQQLANEVRDIPDADFVIVPEDAKLLLELLNKFVAAGAKPESSGGEDRGLAESPELPPDFSAEAYLLHNPDVAAAGMDPERHYVIHGWREGRRFRLF